MIEDTLFMDSFITARTQSGNNKHGLKLRIHDTDFKNSFPVNIGTEKITINNGPCKQLNYLCLSGNWNILEILRSNLEGNRQNQLHGVEVMQANIQTLNLINVKSCFLYSALVIWSSAIGIFNLSDSIFLGNRDGIDIGQGVRYVLISRSEMNNTGSWSGEGQVTEKCSSALKGSATRFKVEDSVFAHNRASGKNCTGAAVYLRSSVYDVNPLGSNDENFGGRVVKVYAEQHVILITASTFEKNEAFKGAGLYIDMSDRWRWSKGFSQNRTASQAVSSIIIIEKCEFNENIAEFGAGLVTYFTESMLTKGSSFSTLIYNSSFHRNKATLSGAGAYLHYFKVSVHNDVTIMIKFSSTEFIENINTGQWPNGNGGGMHVKFTSLSLMSSASVKTAVNNCSFTSNTAGQLGGGISVRVESCFVNSSHSSIILQTIGSTFTTNRANQAGGGIYALVDSCSVASHSSITLQTIDSTFISNRAVTGTGIQIWLTSCSVESYSSIMSETTHSAFITNTGGSGSGINAVAMACSVYLDSSITLLTNNSIFLGNRAGLDGAAILTRVVLCSIDWYSSIISQTTDSNFTSNIAELMGAGILTEVHSCSVDSHSSLLVRTIDSTFTSNTAEWLGAGIYTDVRSCSVDSDSSFTLHTTGSIFTFNTARDEGAGIFIMIHSRYINRNSFFEIQTTDCSFMSGKSERGAGLSVKHESEDTCVYGEVTVAITDCRFLNNSASREGGSLYFKVFLTTQVKDT